MQQTKVREIAMHEGPHIDECATVVILTRYGDKVFPVASTANFVFWSHGGATPDGRPAEDWLRQGTLCIGVGFGGEFNEHPDPARGIPRKAGECAASLMARTLGFGPNNSTPIGRAVNYLVNSVKAVDLNGNPGLLSLEQTLSAMSRCGHSSEEMLDWGARAVGAILDDQIKFHEEARRAFGCGYRYRPVGDSPLTLATVHSRSEHACKVARVVGKAGVVVRCDPKTCHVTIMTDRKQRIPIDEMVYNLRQLEGSIVGDAPPGDTREEAVAEGRLRGWFYHPGIRLITSGGGRGARKTAPPRASFDDIVATVVDVLKQSQPVSVL